MPLPGNVEAAAAGLKGFDTDVPVTSATAAAFFADGYRFCIRYVTRSPAQGSADLTAAEAADILGAGLALFVVQHPRFAGWAATQKIGAADGVYAAYHAHTIGFPAGVNVWCDLEGVSSQSAAADVIAYCNAWYDAVAKAGFVPGIYVGANAILDGTALHNLKFMHYWKSLSTVPAIPVRGYQMVQSNEHDAHGISIDDNVTQNDLLGDSVLWLTSAVTA